MDLSAQEVNLSVPELFRRYHRRLIARNPEYRMDLYTIAAVVMLLVWAGVTFTVGAPGWMNLLLTAGMFVLIWRMVVRRTPSGPTDKP